MKSSDQLLKRLLDTAHKELSDIADTKWWYDEKFKHRAPEVEDMPSYLAATRIRELEAKLRGETNV